MDNKPRGNDQEPIDLRGSEPLGSASPPPLQQQRQPEYPPIPAPTPIRRNKTVIIIALVFALGVISMMCLAPILFAVHVASRNASAIDVTTSQVGNNVMKIPTAPIAVEAVPAEDLTIPMIYQKDIKIDDLEELKINLTASSAYIYYSDTADQVRVEWYSTLDTDKQKVSAEENGNRVVIEEKYNSLMNFDFMNSQSYVDIYIPRDSLDRFDASLVSGNLNLSAIDILDTEELTVDTVSGTSDFVNIDSDNISIDVGSGSFTCGKLSSDNINISGISGNVYANQIECDKLDAEFVSGALMISDSVNAEERFKYNSVSSDLQIPSISTSKFTFETTSGSLTVDTMDSQQINVSGISGRSDIGLSEFDKITINTVSGETALSFISPQEYKLESNTVSGTINDMAGNQNSQSDNLIVFSSVSGSLNIQ